MHLCSSVVLAGSFLFLWHLCQVLVLGWWWPQRMSLEVYLDLAIWTWAFVCWKISDYSFNFRDCDGLLRFSISSWVSFGKLYFSKNLSISSTLSILLAYNCWYYPRDARILQYPQINQFDWSNWSIKSITTLTNWKIKAIWLSQ